MKSTEYDLSGSSIQKIKQNLLTKETTYDEYFYSFYLNHFNPDTKDVIQGNTARVQFEWDLH